MINAEITPQPGDAPKPFPKLMINPETDVVVLFRRSGQGTVLVAPDESDIGKQYKNLSMSRYKDYCGDLILVNE